MTASNSEQIPGSGPTESSNTTQVNNETPTVELPKVQHTEQQRPPESHSQNTGNDNRAVSDLMAAINALPEKITNSIQEALTPPKAQNTGQAQTVEKPVTQVKTRRSLSQWWFGDQ